MNSRKILGLMLCIAICLTGCEWHDFKNFYMVEYEANGGEGAMDAQQMLNDQPQQLSANRFVRTDYRFIGWNTQPDGSGATYGDGQTVTGHTHLKLYAQWADDAFIDYTFEVNGVDFQMIAIEGGTFDMGAQHSNMSGTNYDAQATSGESPVHTVSVSPFWIGSKEVTQQLWTAVMGQWAHTECCPTEAYGLGDSYPVYYVNYTDAVAFVERLNGILHASGQLPAHRFFRLPTEAEWEFAARGGNDNHHNFFAGDNNADNVAWHSDNAGGKSHPVGGKNANELGLYDMSGNVWEWCSDWFGIYSGVSQVNPTGPLTGNSHVLRGGGWSYAPQYHRVSYRLDGSGEPLGSNYGFRLVMDQF